MLALKNSLFQRYRLKLNTLRTVRINTIRTVEVEMSCVNQRFHKRKPIL